MNRLHLVTLAPGHFHAALIQKEAIAGIDPRVSIYAPFDSDLLAHLQRLHSFNTRPQSPTAWEIEVHAGTNFREQFLRDRPGNVVVLAGRNRPKIGWMEDALAAGMHLLVDKPWIIDAADFPRLKALLARATAEGRIVADVMTERHEVTNALLAELVHDSELFGGITSGSPTSPAVLYESVHYLRKHVAGSPLRRPVWFFDVQQQGQPLTDVGTHLVDLVPWTLFPEQPIDWANDLVVGEAKAWPTPISRSDFSAMTGADDFPESLRPSCVGDTLAFAGNNEVAYTLRGVQVRLRIRWEIGPSIHGSDEHHARYVGQRAMLTIEQGAEAEAMPEVFVTSRRVGDHQRLGKLLQQRIAALQAKFPGVGGRDLVSRWQVTIPSALRIGHEAHFAKVVQQVVGWITQTSTLPAWEQANLLAKYYLTTSAVASIGS